MSDEPRSPAIEDTQPEPTVLIDLLAGPEGKSQGRRGVASAQCRCGRFAKHLGTWTSYNGSYAAEEITVSCSRCGVVTVQTV